MSGVYIKGMEMPKENQRGLWVVIHADGIVEYDSGDEGWKTLKQAAYPVPPHGRLGDLDRLEAQWANCDHGAYYDKTNFVRSIQKAPTIIPANKEG